MTDREQLLLHLVDRARRGVALPEELDQLAAGVGALDQLRADLDRVQQAACRTAETLRHAEDRLVKAGAALTQVEAIATRWEKYGSTDLRTAARILRAEVLTEQSSTTTTA